MRAKFVELLVSTPHDNGLQRTALRAVAEQERRAAVAGPNGPTDREIVR